MEKETVDKLEVWGFGDENNSEKWLIWTREISDVFVEERRENQRELGQRIRELVQIKVINFFKWGQKGKLNIVPISAIETFLVSDFWSIKCD
jgi:hypothetical protein